MIRVEDIAAHSAFCRLNEVQGVAIDLRYASTNNFATRVLYAGIDCAWLRREAAQGLERAARCMQAARPGWRILVLDALRPQRVQESIWREVEGTPMAPYFAPPDRGSIHSFGMAVDVTLIDPLGREADMGSGFDEMASISHPALHDELLASGRLSQAQVDVRNSLRDAMAQGGFRGIASEWWHFDHGERDFVRRELPRVY